MGSIWVIEVATEYDGWNGPDTTYEIEPELGFFLTKEEAKACCAQMLEAARAPKYAEYAEKTEAQNRQMAEAYTESMLDYEALQAAGRPVTKPTEPVIEPVLSREEWEASKYRWRSPINYFPVEVKPSGTTTTTTTTTEE